MQDRLGVSADLFSDNNANIVCDKNSHLVEKSVELASAARNSARGKSSRKSSSAFRTISEVADDIGVQQHVLRFWETKFSQVKPLKRGGGRRYYRPEDIELLRAIHNLLHVDGYTIKGVQKLLRDVGKKQFVKSFGTGNNNNDFAKKDVILPDAKETLNKRRFSDKDREILETVLLELKELRRIVSRNCE